MIFIDTGFFIALIEHRDRLHDRARAWMRAIREPAMVSEQVLWETLNYFSAARDRSKAFHFVERVRTSRAYLLVSASPMLFEAGLKLYADRSDKDWSLTDCISFHLMQDRGINRALSHDQHFEQAGFEALLKRDP
jgi:predicted nucleic acid-binding protein